MKAQDFKGQKFFSTNEKWGDISKVEWYHFNHLVLIRKEMKVPFVINCSYELKGHSSSSDHGAKTGRSCATDGYFKTNMTLENQWYNIEAIIKKFKLENFIRIGVYPEWNKPGFHIASSGNNLRWVKIGSKYFYGVDKIIRYFKDREKK